MKTPRKSKDLPSELKRLLEAETATEAARLREAWDLADPPDDQEFPSTSVLDGVWERLEAEAVGAPVTLQAGGPAMPVREARARPRILRLRWLAVAATLLIGAVVYLLRPIEVNVLPGETATVHLDDGTRIELNSGATLRYARFFGKTRGVYLDGEAFFDVARDPKPFVVETFNADVTVLGTSFNVKSWSGDASRATHVALQTGRVQLVSTKRDGRSVIMEPGQTARVSSAGIALDDVDTVRVKRAAAWRRGDFFFSDEWVESILEDVARRFNTKIQVEAGMISQKRMKLHLEHPSSAEAVIAEICSGLQVRYREISGGYELFDPN